jgi:thermitase
VSLARAVAACLVCATIATACSAQAPRYHVAQDRTGAQYVLGHVLVGFERGGQTPVVRVGEKLCGGVVETYMPEIGVALLVYPEKTDVLEQARKLSTYPNVRFAEPDYVVYATFVPNDTDWCQQWGPQRVSCTRAWDVEQGGPATVVAIVDTGIRYTHTDLDDHYLGGYDHYNNDGNPMDDNGHGTHCAGIASAETDNANGIAGVGFGCGLMAVKVLSARGSGPTSSVVAGINWATSNGAHVISLSLGSYSYSNTMQSACENAWNNGVVVCAAAGNDATTTPFYPAAYDACVAVASSTISDNRSSFSNFGASWVDVAAPGSSIYSTYRTSDDSYATMSGTSMACPHVAGAAALLYAELGGARSVDNATIVRAALESTADDVGGWVAWGRINVGGAVAALSEPPMERTYDAESVAVLVGQATGGDATSLHEDDDQCYQVGSSETLRYQIPGLPIRTIHGSEYYAQFDVGGGIKTSGSIDLKGWCTNPGRLRVQVYNFTAGRWEYVLISGAIGVTEQSFTFSFPAATPHYVSPENKVRVKIITSCALPHNMRTDLLQVRAVGL